VRGVLDLQRLQPLVAADAVIEVDDQIAGRQGRGLGEEVGRAALALGPRQPVAQHVGLGDDRETVRGEAVLHRQDGAQIQVLRRRLDIGPVAHGDDVIQPVVGQHDRQPFRRTLGPGGEQDALALLFQGLGMVGDGLEQIDAVLRPLGREGPAQTAAGVFARGVERGQAADVAARQGAVPVLIGQVEAVRRQGAVGRPALGQGRLAPGLIGVLGQGPAFAARRLDLVVQEDGRVVGQIVEQGLELRIEQRQPVLHALTPRALGHGDIEGIVARRTEQTQIAGAEARDGLGVQQGLGHRRQGDLLALAGRALGGRIEGPDRFQLGAEHVQTHRLLEARREDVDDPAAHGVFAALVDGRGAHIAVGREVAFSSAA
jgi:hypothetical protein